MKLLPSCPQCGSKKIRVYGKIAKFFACIFTAGVFMWLGILFPLFFFVSVIALVAAPVMLFLPAHYQCRDCKKNYTDKDLKKLNPSS